MRQLRTVLIGILVGLVLLTLGVLAAGRLGLLSGQAPTGLGVHDGRLKAPSTTPNSVSSQAELWPGHPGREYAAIAPLAWRPGDADGRASMAALHAIVQGWPGARTVSSNDDYLYATFTTPLMRYVDDVEFWRDPQARVLQLRSASRLGSEDLGANRQRIEALRAALAAAP